jgi:hypothetical protein
LSSYVMKRGVVLFAALLLLALFLNNVSADLNATVIDNGYSCLQNKTADCSSSLDENIFTLLSIKTCSDEVLKASSSDECWPSGSCNVKQTSQALLALKQAGEDISKPEAWLFSKNRTATGMEWFLQIETSDPSLCNVSYTGHSYQVYVTADKKVGISGSSSCLSVDQGGYWLKIASQCQSNDYTITCDKDFQTSTLFKKQTSDTIYVTGEEINSASSGGETTEHIDSMCFADSSSCSYEGTLWAALALNSMNDDVSPYIPYLVVMADDNPKTLPDSFLYLLAGEDYRASLLEKQKSSKYWDASGDKYYDTALALLALSADDSTEKSDALGWLADTQSDDGCWQGSIKDTAFILYAVSPRAGVSGGGTSLPDCETTGGGYCMTSSSCFNSNGNELSSYQCSLGLVCCDKPKLVSTCAGQGGDICTGSEQCTGGIVSEASDVTYGECCVGGSCTVPGGNGGTEENNCEINNGICESFQCSSGEQQDNSLSCGSSSQVCCIAASSSGSLWIWILAIAIVIVMLAIIFRDKLRRFWLYFRTKSRPSGPSGSSGHGPPFFPAPMRQMIQRRILPSQGRPGPAPARRRSSELDDVLKKLKDMSR